MSEIYNQLCIIYGVLLIWRCFLIGSGVMVVSVVVLFGLVFVVINLKLFLDKVGFDVF